MSLCWCNTLLLPDEASDVWFPRPTSKATTTRASHLPVQSTLQPFFLDVHDGSSRPPRGHQGPKPSKVARASSYRWGRGTTTPSNSLLALMESPGPSWISGPCWWRATQSRVTTQGRVATAPVARRTNTNKQSDHLKSEDSCVVLLPFQDVEQFTEPPRTHRSHSILGSIAILAQSIAILRSTSKKPDSRNDHLLKW